MILLATNYILSYEQFFLMVVLFGFPTLLFWIYYDLTTYTVIRISDGDTIVVKKTKRSKEIKVRLIGVDAPESTTLRFGYTEKGGINSKEFLQKELPIGCKVRLEYDKQRLCPHGRTLAYVYRKSKFINNRIIRYGFGKFAEYKPNVKYSKLFKETQSRFDKKNPKKS